MGSARKPRICIIGAGAGGGTAAIELAKLGRVSVVVVDMDRLHEPYKQQTEPRLQARVVGHPFNQDTTRGFGFGGSTNLWHGVLATLDEEDWAHLDRAAGTPVSQEIKVLYKDLGRSFGWPSRQSAIGMVQTFMSGSLYNEFASSGEFVVKDFFLQKHPWRIRKELQAASRSGQDITFIEGAVALSLVGDPSQRNRAAALIVSSGGRREVVNADYFVLAAGALETPRIILQGNRTRSFVVDNENIGRNLMDHPWTVIGEITSRRGWFRMGLSDIYASRGMKYRVGSRLRDNIDAATPGANHCISLKPGVFGEYASFREAMKMIITSQLSIRALAGLFRRFRIRDIAASLFLLGCERFGLGVISKKALVFLYLEQPSRKESAVTLQGLEDEAGRDIPAVNWVVGPEEEEAISRTQGILSKVSSASRNFSFFPYANAEQSLASGSHHAGTMRIGRDQHCGVVDSNLKMFGTSNVYVADLSIFPNFGNSNPTFTLSAFATRLARHLSQVSLQ